MRVWALSLLLAGCGQPEVARPIGPGLPPPPAAFPPAPGTPTADAPSWYADCGPGRTLALADLLPSIADSIARQHIPYSLSDPDEWRDCSGVFLRLSSYVAGVCPSERAHLAAPAGVSAYVAGASNVLGLRPAARSSRDLARWYQDEGRFVALEYPPGQSLRATLDRYRYLIKPGSVLWFARRPSGTEEPRRLFVKTEDAGIRHVGTVVATERDEDGRVVQYSMYHAGNTGRDATVTDEHRFEPTGGGPPFGNGDDYLVAIGTLLPVTLPPN
jgi:hypothetical protein